MNITYVIYPVVCLLFKITDMVGVQIPEVGTASAWDVKILFGDKSLKSM
jgi:hypothetical protein